jgi:hypothetical protein
VWLAGRDKCMKLDATRPSQPQRTVYNYQQISQSHQKVVAGQNKANRTVQMVSYTSYKLSFVSRSLLRKNKHISGPALYSFFPHPSHSLLVTYTATRGKYKRMVYRKIRTDGGTGK